MYILTWAMGLTLVAGIALPVAASEPVDLEMVTKIRHEGFDRSQVMATLEHLTEVIGARVTGSPAMNEANAWTRDRLTAWGLENASLEPFEFGTGWSFTRSSAHVLAPIAMPLLAVPMAWTPGTDGVVRGKAVHVKIETEKDLEPLRGTLAGKIVLVDEMDPVDPAEKPIFRRYDESDLHNLCGFPVPTGDRSARLAEWQKSLRKMDLVNSFLIEEGALMKVQISSRDAGVLRVTRGASHDPKGQAGVTSAVLAVEHYNKIGRWLEEGREVELEFDIEAAFHTDDPLAYNTVAEIPGGKKKNELVLLGAHLDSWHAGTGATDNGTGVAVMMEAVRILKAVGAKMDRTVRIVLWSGEEQGLIGSRAHVAQHFATRPAPPEDQRHLPRALQDQTWPITPLKAHGDFSVYFNLDNGAGRIRGIYAQHNAAVKPIFDAWLAPFADLGAETVTLQNTGSTDHVAFDEVGLPGFQFVQDPMAYMTRTHHTNLDVIDNVVEADLKQAAVIVASFVYHAATRAEKLPRAPMPRAPENGKVSADE